jgi:hypothetical protein
MSELGSDARLRLFKNPAIIWHKDRKKKAKQRFRFFSLLVFFYSEKSNDSKNLVVKIPALKLGSFINFKWNGMVVFTPSITNSLKALSIVLIASSRV